MADEVDLRKAVLLYASFDTNVRADFGGGGREFGTRFGKPGEPGTYTFEKSFDAKVFRIAAGKGIHGGALQAVDVLPNNGRIYLPVRGHLDFKFHCPVRTAKSLLVGTAEPGLSHLGSSHWPRGGAVRFQTAS